MYLQSWKRSRKFIKTNALGLPNVNELEEEKRKGQRGRLGDPSSVVHLREVDVL